MEPSDLDLFWAVACDVSLLLTRSDDFRRSQHESGDYVSWLIEHSYVVVPAQLDSDQASRRMQWRRSSGLYRTSRSNMQAAS